MTKKIQEKEDNYGPLIFMLQVTYPEYRFLFIPVIVGAMGAIPIDVNSDIKKLFLKKTLHLALSDLLLEISKYIGKL